MWFRYPPGWDNITVEGVEFHVDHKDRDGNQYFTAPDNLADRILIVPGFAVVGRPDDASPDIKDATPQAVNDPLAQLSSQVETLRTENQSLKDGARELENKCNELLAENDALRNQLIRLHQTPETPAPKETTTTPAPTTETKPPAPATAPAGESKPSTSSTTGSSSTSGTRK